MTLAAPTLPKSISYQGGEREYTGSFKSNWVIANSDITTVNTGSLLRPGLSTGESNIVPLVIPNRATRVLVRTRFPHTGVTFTTHPVVRFYTIDAGDGATLNETLTAAALGLSVPDRIDTATSNGAGLTITGSASMARNDSYRYSDVTSLTGYDCLGGSVLIALIETAAAGASYTGVVMVKFLN